MRKNWKTSEINELKSLYTSGFKAQEISKILQRSQQSINRALSRYAFRNQFKTKNTKAVYISPPSSSIDKPLAPIAYLKFKAPTSLSSYSHTPNHDYPDMHFRKSSANKVRIEIHSDFPNHPAPFKEEDFNWGGLEDEIKWAHQATPLRILPIKKPNMSLIFYVRSVENPKEKSYLNRKSLLTKLNQERKNLRLSLFKIG